MYLVAPSLISKKKSDQVGLKANLMTSSSNERPKQLARSLLLR